MTTDTPHSTSLQDMAEEIFGLTIMAWRDHIASRGLAAELSESQFLTLDFLQHQSPATVGEIQRAINVLPAQMSRIIRSLEANFDKPLICRELNQQDKRKIDVTVTPEGFRVYHDFRNNKLAKTQDILAHLPDHDRTEFVRICKQIKTLYQLAKPSETPE